MSTTEACALNIATTPEIDQLLSTDCPVAIGISGGKDSSAVAIATVRFLDSIGHRGPRLLIHSDLGVTEWRASLPGCQRLAGFLGVELVVVRRARGDMMDRWEQRWRDNVARYEQLSCVQLILPWSTPSMRFCTSEMKTDIICRELVRRFPGRTILSVTGIRRQESSARARAPIAKIQPKLQSVTYRTRGLDWHPIIDWPVDEVLGFLNDEHFPLHEAYTRYGSSRVSCAFCIMSNEEDLAAASRCADNVELFRRMVDLEIKSTFAFQGNRWLADVAPRLLSGAQEDGLSLAKSKAEARRRMEALIPRDLLYTKGWPTAIPTRDSAELLGDIRDQIGSLLKLRVRFTSATTVINRYQELWAAAQGGRHA